MDVKVIQQAALLTLRGAICERLPAGKGTAEVAEMDGARRFS
jgi:hypothetical protein